MQCIGLLIIPRTSSPLLVDTGARTAQCKMTLTRRRDSCVDTHIAALSLLVVQHLTRTPWLQADDLTPTGEKNARLHGRWISWWAFSRINFFFLFLKADFVFFIKKFLQTGEPRVSDHPLVKKFISTDIQRTRFVNSSVERGWNRVCSDCVLVVFEKKKHVTHAH